MDFISRFKVRFLDGHQEENEGLDPGGAPFFFLRMQRTDVNSIFKSDPIPLQRVLRFLSRDFILRSFRLCKRNQTGEISKHANGASSGQSRPPPSG